MSLPMTPSMRWLSLNPFFGWSPSVKNLSIRIAAFRIIFIIRWMGQSKFHLTSQTLIHLCPCTEWCWVDVCYAKYRYKMRISKMIWRLYMIR
jgi:hypothetical protein